VVQGLEVSDIEIEKLMEASKPALSCTHRGGCPSTSPKKKEMT
jgi:hypothetical protein